MAKKKELKEKGHFDSVEVKFLEDSIYFKKGQKTKTTRLNAIDLVNKKMAKVV